MSTAHSDERVVRVGDKATILQGDNALVQYRGSGSGTRLLVDDGLKFAALLVNRKSAMAFARLILEIEGEAQEGQNETA